jgi:hypothetical protein
MTKSRSRILPLLLVNLGIAAVCVIVLELIFGNWFHPNLTDRLNLVRDTQRRYDASALYDGAGDIIYTRDQWALRGDYPSLDDIDILTMGGSATDQRYITDGATWQDVIIREFAAEGRKVSVVNAGVDGQSTYGHIRDFDWWFPTIPEFKPRYVLFYIGGNDMFKGADSDFDDLVNEEPPNWKHFIRERSVFFRMAQTGVGIWRARHVHKISHHKEPFGSWTWTTQPLVKDHYKLAERSLERYRKALDLLAKKTRAIGAEPIFVSQSLSLYRFRPDGTLEGKADQDVYDRTLLNGVDYYYVMREFWKVTMDECAKSSGFCIDAANEIRWEPGDFYDSIHNTPQGAERLGKFLYSRLRELPIATAEVAH